MPPLTVPDDLPQVVPPVFWEHSGDLFAVFDAQGRFVRANPSWQRVLGWDEGELVGRHLAEVVHPDDAPGVAALTVHGSHGLGPAAETESRWLCADGTLRWLLWSAYGGGGGRYGVGKDITRRRDTEWRLRTSNVQLGAVVENTSAAIYVKRKGDFRYLLVNPQCERLLGLKPGSGVGLRDEDVHTPDVVATLRQTDRQVVEQGIEITLEEEVLVRGESRAYLTRKFPLRDDTGEPYAVCGISTDITERQLREADLSDRLAWAERISAAVEQERLLVYAQPILDLRTGTIVQEELLVRLRGERGDRSVIEPAYFLPQAERYGLIGQIDRYMVRRGIELAAAGRSVEINLSAQSIGDHAVTRQIDRELGKTGADPSRVVFEITETAAVEDIQAAVEFSERIARIGCKCALDDFGTGFGSLTYQRHLAVQFLKIDISFVRGMARSQADQQVVRSIVQMAHDYGQQTVAEGVEDQETLDMLGAMGVGYAQGFHIGRPRPVTAAYDSTGD